MAVSPLLDNTTYRLNDRWARIIGIPFFGILISFFHNHAVLLQFDDQFFLTLLPSMLVTATLWEGHRPIFIWMRRQYPRPDQTPTRLLWQTLLSVSFTLLAGIFIDNGMELLLHRRLCEDDSLFKDMAGKLIPTLFITSMYESAYFFVQWKQNIRKSEALARENIQSQLDVLKSQIDPHFLFNSHNTLAALIDEQNEPAQKYLEQLSDVYRYVLLNKDKSTVTLQEEMAFVEAYLYLNKTRFRENLRFETQLSEKAQRRQIAPLSLQMLVENAIKHNVISKGKPLTIKIFEEKEEWITVENNVQAKKVLEKSTKVGLQNIINRYRLLSALPIEIRHDAERFTVKIPLLA